MKTVTIAETFDGYPQGAKEGSRRTTYTEGQEIEVSDAFGELIIGKGLAREKGAGRAASKPEAAEPAVQKDQDA
ncbi:hypothetical protein Q8W71_17685 [Methylobacterium sp. NEAU 140]|uniref:hypothetical protein n=1 Tax=Methylobacterium sp. NEAU 140 TaxID=3064945 RepID=UPI0027329EEF|nr:hypothetical protein [Methylobacterium sp. NEAU 140]MDP4024460.1 hypothetical protein [Methylobacterium sp. NEAU 140]